MDSPFTTQVFKLENCSLLVQPFASLWYFSIFNNYKFAQHVCGTCVKKAESLCTLSHTGSVQYKGSRKYGVKKTISLLLLYLF